MLLNCANFTRGFATIPQWFSVSTETLFILYGKVKRNSHYRIGSYRSIISILSSSNRFRATAKGSTGSSSSPTSEFAGLHFQEGPLNAIAQTDCQNSHRDGSTIARINAIRQCAPAAAGKRIALSHSLAPSLLGRWAIVLRIAAGCRSG